ncbi:MAG TPA: RNA polymerase sigma factor [Rhodanobacteraceae bacterium]|nr:RNA polymerase sigma factor [Rhodanobacteraceae bacterium]
MSALIAPLKPDPAAVATADTELVHRVLAGDRAAFAVIMRRYNQRLFRVARAVLGNHTEAKDAVQDAYLAAYRALGEFRGDAQMATWLTRIVLNECMGRQRTEHRRQRIAPMVSMESDMDATRSVPDTQPQPEAAAARAEMRALLQRRVDALPDNLRVVFVLRAVEEMSVRETAEHLGISAEATRIRYFRARCTLRKSLAELAESVQRDLYEFGCHECDELIARVFSRLDP